MESQTKICQNCKQSFVVEPEDFEFYEKMKVPAPTFCPGCRLQRRLAFYNLFTLYKRKCDLCKKDSISMYPPEAQYVVYCHQCWWSDKWDPFSYGRDYDFSRPFFEQYNTWLHAVPLLGLANSSEMAATSPYANQAARSRNCYLIFEADENEDCMYGYYILFSKSTLDSSLIYSSERMYDSSNCYKDNSGIGLRDQVTESIDCAFLRHSHNCQNCFASANLRNKKYVAFNKQYTKEAYLEFIKKYDLGSYKTYKDVEALAREHWKKYTPDPDVSTNAINSTGSHIFESKNCKECYETVGAEDCKYMILMASGPVRDCYDVSEFGENLSRSYECMSVGMNASDIKFSKTVGVNAFSVEYSMDCLGGSHIFGSAGLKKGEYVIFNKPYSEEEYVKMRRRIVQHMNEMPFTDKCGNVYRYGEFFPIEINPHAYNETIAVNFFPLQREKVEQNAWRWREPDNVEYKVTIKAVDLPDQIKDAQDSITQEIIACMECGRGFRVLPEELKFRRSMNVPLARACPFCRIKEKFDQWVGKMRLTDRTCDQCGMQFRTHYTKENAPHILCKACYLKEVI